MLNFCLYKPCAMCLSLLHFQPCAGSEPDCNCCLSNKYTYMQLRSPEVTRVNIHLSGSIFYFKMFGPFKTALTLHWPSEVLHSILCSEHFSTYQLSCSMKSASATMVTDSFQEFFLLKLLLPATDK